jgi:hypothetical protein
MEPALVNSICSWCKQQALKGVLNDKAKADANQILLDIKHMKLVKVANKPSGVGLAVCINQAVNGSNSRKPCMDRPIQVRNMVVFLSFIHY